MTLTAFPLKEAGCEHEPIIFHTDTGYDEYGVCKWINVMIGNVKIDTWSVSPCEFSSSAMISLRVLSSVQPEICVAQHGWPVSMRGDVNTTNSTATPLVD